MDRSEAAFNQFLLKHTNMSLSENKFSHNNNNSRSKGRVKLGAEMSTVKNT